MKTKKEAVRFFRVALALDLRERYFREVRAGICEYALPRDPWVFRGVDRGARGWAQAKRWQADGAILGLDDARVMERWRQGSFPVVRVSGRLRDDLVPRVGVDDGEVGRMAAEHFLEKGFHSLAFLGSRNDAYAQRRQEGFTRAAARRSIPCAVRFGETLNASEDRALGRWLRELPKPAGLLAADDRWALRASEVARECGIDIPHELALLGVGDDDLCGMTFPRLSSVRLPGRQIGMEAARLLERMLRGESAPASPLLLPPTGIRARASSDVVAVADPLLRQALAFIDQHSGRNLRVDELARHAGMNRRSLELRFREQLGLSPLAQIRKSRIRRVRDLLLDTDLRLEDIAERLDFPNSQRMAVVFRQMEHQSPGAFRRAFRTRAEAEPGSS